MSGGSFDGLYAKFAQDLLEHREGLLPDMADSLKNHPGAEGAQADTLRIINLLESIAEIFLAVDDIASPELRATWKAVEWLQSLDGGREDVQKAVEAFNKKAMEDMAS